MSELLWCGVAFRFAAKHTSWHKAALYIAGAFLPTLVMVDVATGYT
jgi:hypothetical protein